MTKKHFIALANVFKKTQPQSSPLAPEYTQWWTDVNLIADVLEETNPRFNRQLWFDYINGKCGPSGGKIK